MGIEPTSRAWEARILPMNYARNDFFSIAFLFFQCKGEFYPIDTKLYSL